MEVKRAMVENFGKAAQRSEQATGENAESPVPADACRPQTLPGLLEQSAARMGSELFLPRRHNQEHGEPVTFSGLLEDVRRLARGLLFQGIRHGDRVGILAENSHSWLLCDLAISYIGAIDVPRGADTAPGELRGILSHSGCRMVFVADDDAAREILAMQDGLPGLELVASLATQCSVAGVLSLTELMQRGDAWQGSLEQERLKVCPQDLLTIVYTSGTTADPKGVMLTHQNVISNLQAIGLVLDPCDTDVFLSILPAWHVYERIMNYLALAVGGQLVYTDKRNLKQDLGTVQPTIFAAVPRLWENIHAGILNHCGKLSFPRRQILRLVLSVCQRVGAGKAGPFYRWLHRLAEKTILPSVLEGATGGRLRLAVSGGGALPLHVDEQLLGLGLPLLNGYGLTETSPVVSIRLPRQNRVGTIGPPIPGTEVEIRDPSGQPLSPGQTGLLWIRGPQVMQGYFNNPEGTAMVMDRAGFFNSGDLANIDSHGHIRITGRAKDTIVLASGENVEPEPLETGIKSSELVDQAVVLGQDQKTLGAILIPTAESLEKRLPRQRWGEEGGVLRGEAVRRLFRQELDRLLSRDKGFRPCEKVARFQLRLEPMTVENGLLTPTLKVRRNAVRESMAEMIEEMFSS